MNKLKPNQYFKSVILERMFMLFQDKERILEETPVSYFNKILLQFIYQKPEEVFFLFIIKIFS